MSNRAYGDWYAQDAENFPTAKEVEKMYPSRFNNPMFHVIVTKYLICVKEYFA